MRHHCVDMRYPNRKQADERTHTWILQRLNCALICLVMFACSHRQDTCQVSDSCKEKGLCVSLQGSCVAVTQQHCLQSADCAEHGLCSVHNGRCAALTKKDCQSHSSVCARTGQCDVSQYACISKRTNSCRTAREKIRDVKRAYIEVELCSGLGHCRAVDGRCQPGGDSDCRNAFVCREWGRCSSNRGTCLAENDADCRRSRACLQTGACKAKMGKCEKP